MRTYGLVGKAKSSDCQWVGWHRFYSLTGLKLSAALWPFCVAMSPSVHSHVLFYIAALSMIVFSRISSVAISRWAAYRVLTLNMNIWLPLFWSTWSGARGLDSATCAAWRMGSDNGNCIAAEQKCLRRLGDWYSLSCPKYWKTVAHAKGFSTLSPQMALCSYSS